MIFYYSPILGLQYNYKNPLTITINFLPLPQEIKEMEHIFWNEGILHGTMKTGEIEKVEVKIWSNL